MQNIGTVRTALLAVAAATMTAACGSGISVRSDYDPGKLQAIQTYRTYSWLPDPQGGRQGGTQLVAARIQAAVDAELASKGYTKVTSDPDFQVGWHVATQDKQDIETFNNYYGYGYGAWGYGGPIYGGSQVYTRNYTQGTLLIDVVDAATNQLAWRGTAEGEIDPNASQEKRTQNINAAVAEVMDDFPPNG